MSCMLPLICVLLGALNAGAEILHLDDDSFQSVVEGADLAVVVFHAPWCHHCHNYLTNIFQPAATQLASEDVKMATLDIEEAKEVQSKYVIKQVPSLRLFRRGMMFPYDGPGQHVGVEGLVQYLKDEKAKQGLGENPVITLTNDNFDDITASTELILVEFYTDMCTPCQQLEPIFADAARQLLTNDPPIRLGHVQIPDQMEVAKRFPLEGYPLLIMFRYGNQYNYTGPKDTAEGIVEYMRRQAGPSSILLERVEDVKKFIHTRELSVVAYFADNQDSAVLDDFLESGNLVRTDMKLGYTQDEGVALHMNQRPDTIVVYHPIHLVSDYESGYSVIPSPPANATELWRLYLEHARPLVGQMTKENYDTIFKHRPMLLTYYDVDWSRDGFKATQYWHNMVASVASEFLESGIVFAIANEEDYPDDLRALSLADWGEDVAVGLFAPGPLKYAMMEELTADSLSDFLQSYVDGELKPRFNSEPVPKPEKGALIRKVVGSTFQQEVGNVKKDVMVLLCIPTLPDCKTASEYYVKLATQFKGVKNLFFSEMNVALNDPPVGTSISSLPTFLFSPSGSKEISPVTPQPKDEADLAFFLKYKQNIKPLRPKVKGGKSASEKDEL